MLTSSYAFWLLLGIALLLSELFISGLIAAFFGVAAIIVGLLTLMGLVDSLPIQLAIFTVLGLASLFALRHRFRRWLMGSETDPSTGDLDNAGIMGARVEVIEDFEKGAGKIKLNGAKWDAESDEPLKVGEPAWVVGHNGIVLKVSASQQQ